jgi:putative transposase
MVAKKRRFEPGFAYHVLNRGTIRQRLFLSDDDYEQFEALIVRTFERTSIEIFTYELMPNHWHFLVRAATKEQLSDFFQYLSSNHSKRFRVVTNSVGEGHVYQDRFKSFPIECDDHFLTVARYIERNAKRAGLVERAEDWRWGGLWRRLNRLDEWLTSDWPVARSTRWIEFVNAMSPDSELNALRTCIKRGSPFGSPKWSKLVARQLGLEHTLSRPGRPRKFLVE